MGLQFVTLGTNPMGPPFFHPIYAVVGVGTAGASHILSYCSSFRQWSILHTTHPNPSIHPSIDCNKGEIPTPSIHPSIDCNKGEIPTPSIHPSIHLSIHCNKGEIPTPSIHYNKGTYQTSFIYLQHDIPSHPIPCQKGFFQPIATHPSIQTN